MDTDRLFVKSLTLENFRCFEKAEFGPFDPNFNLLVGINGAGKSSILLALANSLRKFGDPEARHLPNRLVDQKDIRLKHWVGTDEVTSLKLCLPSRIEVSFCFQNANFRTSDYLNSIEGGPTQTYRSDAKGIESAIHPSKPWSELYENYHNDPISLIAFYRVHRNFETQALGPPVSGRSDHRLVGVENWSNAGTSAARLREWVKNQTLIALQRRFRERSSDVEPSPSGSLRQLLLVQEAIATAVDGVTLFEFDADRDDIVIKFSDGSLKDFSWLSDGQRAMIGLVGDIARRVCSLNAPYLGARTLKETSGIVLIDELDLHLHPTWQRRIVGALKQIFPKIQFFATTHSPQVIGEARPEEIVLLTPQGQKRLIGSYGMDSNWVLECVMEAEGRDPAIARRIKDLFDAIDQDRIEEAKAMISALRADIGNAPDIAGAESYIWRIEHQGDEAAE